MSAPTLPCLTPDQTREAVRRGAECLRGGGVIVFPTETVYGVGAAVDHPEALTRLRQLKRRSDQQPFTIHLPDPESVRRYVDLRANPGLARLVRKTMPGPITVLVDVPEPRIGAALAELGLPPEARDRLYHGPTIGLRCPDHPVAQQLLAAVSAPVVASSANRAGDPPPIDVAGAAALAGEVDLMIDGGPCRYSKASTIVHVAGRRLKLIRAGAHDQRYLDKLMQQSILFVCSGNTCRSPMAEAIARAELAERLGVRPDDAGLAQAGVSVASAGLMAHSGAPMTEEAQRALRAMNLPAPEHRSHPLTSALLAEADAVFCMTGSHLTALHAHGPEVAAKSRRLDPSGDIDDPIGGGGAVYLECAEHLRRVIRLRLDELGFARAT